MHSFTNCLLHCVFGTKNRDTYLSAEIRLRLWPYFGAIDRDHGIRLLEVGGVSDHVHLLISLPATITVAKAMQLLKANSSKWLHDTFPHLRNTAWQEGYGAFSIGAAGTEATLKYIRDQEEHHRTKTFREEFEQFLRRNGIKFDPSQLD